MFRMNWIIIKRLISPGFTGKKTCDTNSIISIDFFVFQSLFERKNDETN